MKIFATLSVLPQIPAPIARLRDLASNLWWSWDSEAQNLFASLDPELWDAANHNPVKLLRDVEQSRLDHAAQDSDFLLRYKAVMRTFDDYMDEETPTWFRTHYADGANGVQGDPARGVPSGQHSAHIEHSRFLANHEMAAKQHQIIAYFSAEFGLHEALPIYSGGLGVLSGDHCKIASDLGLPFIGVGFLYPQGYFTQRIDEEGRQQALYEKIEFSEVPARPALDPHGNEILISVDLPGRTVFAKIWRIQVGRIPIYLMDTDVDRNTPRDRELSARLYGGDHEMRISQEIVLGIGGVRAVHALGYEPAVWHMNEGHSAFLGLERVRLLVRNAGLSFDEAVAAVRSATLFTTHTPVPAGNDSFEFELIDKFFWHYWEQLGIDRNRFIDFARQELPWGSQYSMTVLALRLSAYHNGVSQLHGKVSREMWNFLWPDLSQEEVPIGHITNGVHTRTWLARELKQLYSRYLAADWTENIEQPEAWGQIDEIPDQELWGVHKELKEKLIRFARRRLQQQYTRHGRTPQEVAATEHMLDANALTIGFARRFATYKRALLLFHDRERIKRILNDPNQPVQVIFSGKAHPADEPGKALIQEIYQLSQESDFEGKILFLEDYDMNVARHMIAGVDLWLNTPRRPREASGTSGQKAALSGVPNCSILDGWWAEAYDGTNGWAIGDQREYESTEAQDEADAQSLYSLLEHDIIPLFYQRTAAGVPNEWVKIMKNAIRTCAPRYSMRRMVIDYVKQYYVSAAASGHRFVADDYQLARDFVAFEHSIRQKWGTIRIVADSILRTAINVGSDVEISSDIWLGEIDPSEITVELVYGRLTKDNDVISPSAVPMQLAGQGGDGGAFKYKTTVSMDQSGKIAFGVRARPSFPGDGNVSDIGLVAWA